MARKKSDRAFAIPRQAIDEARDILRKMLEEPPPLSFRDFVIQVYDEIERFRESGQSWQEIQAHISERVPISIRTLQMYYHDESVRRRREN